MPFEEGTEPKGYRQVSHSLIDDLVWSFLGSLDDPDPDLSICGPYDIVEEVMQKVGFVLMGLRWRNMSSYLNPWHLPCGTAN